MSQQAKFRNRLLKMTGLKVEKSDRGLRALMIVSTLCGVLATSLLARQALFTPKSPTRDRRPPEQVGSWSDLVDYGRRLGPTDAEIVVLEFGDYQCPFCKRFEEVTMQAVERAFPGKVALVFRHWPLKNHVHAYGAARAAECAAVQSSFRPFHTLLFEKQDSIGHKSWVEFARDSRVPDLASFSQCVSATVPHPSIERDIAAVRQLAGHGTPTVIVNGLRFFVVPDSTVLVETIGGMLRAAKGQ